MLNHVFFDTDFYHVIQWFFFYGFLGWIVESAYMSICNRKWTNRGFVKGPFIPIYGIGAILAFFALHRLIYNPILLFAAGSVMATTLEYLTAHLMMVVFGEFWWDYTEKPYNYKGIICLESSIAWGVYTVGFFYYLHPYVTNMLSGYPYELGVFLIKGIFMIVWCDFLCTLYEQKKESLPSSLEEVKEAIFNFF
ncbi:MAG: putative ABC transporter permease [Lachnospiraceae bacterium]|nr:putative ABC transporter permease [Lachnospiraceae bacterium]